METHLVAQIAQKALISQDSKLLIVKSVKGYWELPGGRLNADEEPREGLRREIREELSLEVEPADVFHVDTFLGSSGIPHFVLLYRCEIAGDPNSITLQQEELEDMRWITAEDLAMLELPSSYMERLREFFSSL